jgi:hypothetical protein
MSNAIYLVMTIFSGDYSDMVVGTQDRTSAVDALINCGFSSDL